MNPARHRRAYRLLLRLLPADFRRRNDAQLEDMFGLELQDAHRRGGWRGVSRTWLHAASDVLRFHAPRMHRESSNATNLEGRLTMGRETRTGGSLFGGIQHDLRFAVRTLRRRPAYTGTILLTLVLAIGATTAVFSVVNGVLLRLFSHPDPEQLVLVYEVDARGADVEDHNPVAGANYGDW